MLYPTELLAHIRFRPTLTRAAGLHRKGTAALF